MEAPSCPLSSREVVTFFRDDNFSWVLAPYQNMNCHPDRSEAKEGFVFFFLDLRFSHRSSDPSGAHCPPLCHPEFFFFFWASAQPTGGQTVTLWQTTITPGRVPTRSSHVRAENGGAQPLRMLFLSSKPRDLQFAPSTTDAQGKHHPNFCLPTGAHSDFHRPQNIQNLI